MGYLVSDHPTVVTVGTVAIGLTLHEVAEEVEVVHRDGKYVRVADLPARRGRAQPLGYISKRHMPSGRFAIRAYSPYPNTTWEQEWVEAKPGDFSNRLVELGEGLEKAAPVIARRVAVARKEAEEHRIRWEAQQREWKKEELERRGASGPGPWPRREEQDH